MATLLQHVKPWMQCSIAEFEEMMEHLMDQKVHAVHKCHNAFEERVLERPTLTIDLTTFQRKLAQLPTNVATLLAPPESKIESAPTTPVDRVVINSLFGDDIPLPDSSRATGKHPRSARTFDNVETEILRTKERQ
uniref:Integrase core domain containing protein n=1 Tax=Solanum tuberosum TaxID=4113 RepID=M1DG01_SOLTU